MGHNITGDTAVKIADSVESEIAKGRLTPGDQLPSVRLLAQELGVNRNTISSAYQRLSASGVIVADGRRGTRIAAAPPLFASGLISETVPGVRPLNVGGPDPALLPDLGPAIASIKPEVREYGQDMNVPELMEIGRAYFNADGYRTGRIAIAGGALDSLERVLRAHLRPGDVVGMEDPGFLAGVALVRSMGLHPISMAIDEEGVLPDALDNAIRQRARAVILTPRAQNPTGAFISKERARDLKKILSNAPQMLVIEDDHCGPISGTPAISVAHDHVGPWAILRSVCKFLGPDLRLGFVLGDETTIARLDGHLALGMRWVSHLLQRTVICLWEDQSTHKMIAGAARTYQERRNALLKALSERGIPATGRSGLNVWVPVARETQTVQGLYRSGWAVAAGEGFRLASEPGIRITTSQLAAPESEELADTLLKLWSGQRLSLPT